MRRTEGDGFKGRVLIVAVVAGGFLVLAFLAQWLG
jgi:hypothetical protein